MCVGRGGGGCRVLKILLRGVVTQFRCKACNMIMMGELREIAGGNIKVNRLAILCLKTMFGNE